MATLEGIEIPDDLQWTDEFLVWGMTQQAEVSVGGALLLEEWQQLAGRPITLQSGQDGTRYWGVVTRAIVEQLHALANAPRATAMTLVLADAREFAVRWRAEGFEAKPWKHIVPAEAGDYYTITLRLQEAPDPE